jgi:hypothetical protein
MCEDFYGDTNQKSPFRNIRLTTVTCGTSAPFLLHEETADDHQELHPRAAQVLYTDFFVDLLSGSSALEEAMHLQRDVLALL